ncbi:hypothetical protein L3Q82_015443 [Scortum barcoo]|uniref:Uncharacterized protein n=1 Tax=Scortum barcoo TaxID=214431 RepID=A0ACB8VP67_9TELE|nr:hypothetical protein L3Q82_015443 [Scortum barcoo]
MHLPLVLMAYRSAVQDSTSCTPALLMLGRELRTPAEMAFGRPPDTPRVPPGPEYARRLQDRMESAHAFARNQLQKAGVRQKRNYDIRARGTDFKAGDLVWVYSPRKEEGALAGILFVVQSDSSRQEGPAVPLLHTAWMEQSAH